MKTEFEQEAKDLIRKLDICTQNYKIMYSKLKKILWFHFLMLLCSSIFIIIAFFTSEESNYIYIDIIILLAYANCLLAVLHRNFIKKKMNVVFCEGVSSMGRLSDIIDWSSIRNKFLNKDDAIAVNSITEFVVLIEKTFSPFRHSRNYYKISLYISLFISCILLLLYIFCCLTCRTIS